MTPQQYLVRCRADFERVEVPDGPYRRQGVTNLASIFQEPRRSFAWLPQAVDDGSLTIDEAVAATTERALEVTSLLYATGAPHQLWRHWAALSCFGLLFDGRVTTANEYALLAGEWALAADLPRSTVTGDAEYFPDAVLLGVSGADATATLPDGSSELQYADLLGDVWTSFAAALAERSPVLVTLALHTIADLHIDVFGETWDRFYALEHALFDPAACGAAALARRHGLVTGELSELDRRYLDAGLAEGEPEPLYPTDRPTPSPVGDGRQG